MIRYLAWTGSTRVDGRFYRLCLHHGLVSCLYLDLVGFAIQEFYRMLE